MARRTKKQQRKPGEDPKPIRGELDGKVYTGEDLIDLMRDGLQYELSQMIVTYDDGTRIRPYRFCEKVVSLKDENGNLVIRL